MNKSISNKFNAFCKKRDLNYQPTTSAEIKDLRRLYNLSQRSFADMLDINVRTLQDYELGRIRPSQTATALFTFAKIEIKTFTKYIHDNPRGFVR